MTEFVLLLFYRHGGAIKSRPGVQDIVIKNKTVETDREGGSISEEEENEESAL